MRIATALQINVPIDNSNNKIGLINQSKIITLSDRLDFVSAIKQLNENIFYKEIQHYDEKAALLKLVENIFLE